ncbi:3-hydroxylacyl-ACP dehydratase [Agarivorans sp. TSD2052]|uniref:ApeP family dehydratase n=1 Tax=Agarivorans sp. TSD2052 TaxID=2937286 RepID=UPI00200F5FCC|nr:3-hydroxylacyl-ACP dehydratase [Agarivorans sp. TSD2052]UPW19351.1 3-hydroxylacyl-ACP dehydratase [Agarivorans sp. TSD2052]
MSKIFPNMAEILPHSAPMILIDKVVEWLPGKIICSLEISENSHLFNDVEQAVPTYAAIEYMAQAVAALAGLEAKEQQRPIEVGFLIGTRKCLFQETMLPLGCQLLISAERIYAEEDGLAVCACEVTNQQGVTLTSAHLNVYQPKDAVEFVKGS